MHGDYSFNNTMWSREDPTRMVAVLDWEMSTLGDPLTDLGMVAVYWGEAGEMMWRNRETPQPHRVNAGFPSVDGILARYEASSGRSIRDIDVYQVLAVFKLAIIVEGNLARIRAAAARRGPQPAGRAHRRARRPRPRHGQRLVGPVPPRLLTPTHPPTSPPTPRSDLAVLPWAVRPDEDVAVP